MAAVTPVLYLQLMYTYGFDNSYEDCLSTWCSFTQWSERGSSYGLYGTTRLYRFDVDGFYERYRNIFNGIYGILIVGSLFYLRREFPRFPFSPVGVVLGAEVFHSTQMPFSPLYIWFSFLVAWIAKMLIFRWLGVRSFREKIQPALVMVLCGMIFGIMMYMCRFIAKGWGVLR